MTIKSSGTQLSFSEIEAEFGSNGERSLGDYRLTQNIGELSNLPLDTGVPTSGQIKFSDFYNKKLNVVVNCYSGGDEFHKNAKNDKWNNNSVVVVGGFRSKKESGSKIIIHVNKRFGSDKNGTNRCALRTGSWSNINSMQIDVGSSGKILGAGGDGGAGSQFSGAAGNGGSGSSGLGVEVNNTVVNVVSGGILRAGFGGGGGGGSGRQTDKGEDRKASGGGGGGGQGFPGGSGGPRGSTSVSNTSGGSDGTAGDISEAGEGGNGSQNASEAYGGAGGEGGSFGEGANAGGGGSGKQTGARGQGGGNGAAMRRTSGFTVTINNSGTIQGSTSASNVD